MVKELLSDLTQNTEGPEQYETNLQEILAIPEVESANVEHLPNSDSIGLHLILRKHNRIQVKDILSKVWGGPQIENAQQFLSTYSFLKVDNLAISEIDCRGSGGAPSTSGYEQSIHRRDDKKFHIVVLYHPALDKKHVSTRFSPTFIADFSLYAFKLWKFLITRLSKAEDTTMEGFKELRELVTNQTKNFTEVEPKAKNVISLAEAFERIRYEDYPYLLSNQFSRDFVKDNADKHQWQENQLLVVNDETVVHGRAAAPDTWKQIQDQSVFMFTGESFFKLMK